MWDNITELEKQLPEAFGGIIGGLTHSRKEWKRWYIHSEPETEHLPGEWDAKCEDYIKKMIVLRCLRQDRVMFAVAEYIKDNLGQEFIEPPSQSFSDILEETISTQPIIFVLSPGVDPSVQLQNLAKEKGKSLDEVPLGKGQSIKARNAIADASDKGN